MSAPPEAARDIDRLLGSIRLLELAARRNVAGLLSGDYVTSVRGQGFVFDELRKYVPGEPIRRIDWNTTARLGEPYVRIHQEERQREVFLAVDVSPSMHVGFSHRTKLELAIELAATLGLAAVEGGDAIGWVLFADEVLDERRPRAGRKQLFRLLRTLLEHTGPWERRVPQSDPRAAIHAVQRHRGRRFVVFVISDFIDHDLPDDLRYLQARHDVSLLHVYDPVEYGLPDSSHRGAPLVPSFAPEGDEAWRRLRPGALGGLDEMSAFLAEECARYQLTYASFATDESVAPSLSRLFHRRRQQR